MRDSWLGSRTAVGCWSEAWSVPLVDMGVLSETRHARTAGGVRITHQVVGADPLDILRVGDGLSQVEMTWELPVGAQFNTRPALFSRLIRFDKRGAGLSDPVPLHEIPDLELGEVGPGAEPYPPDGCWAQARSGRRGGRDATPLRPPRSRQGARRRARASVTGTHDAATASLGERCAASTGAGADR